MKKLVVAALVLSTSALASNARAQDGKDKGVIGDFTVPFSEGAVKRPEIVSAGYGMFVVSEHEEGNCDMVSTSGSMDDCRTVAQYAKVVRVVVQYVSEAGADPRPEAGTEASHEGPVTIHFDLDPSRFSPETLAKMQKLGDLRSLFVLSERSDRKLVSVVDYENSYFCPPEADAPGEDCENKVLYKQIEAPITVLSVRLK